MLTLYYRLTGTHPVTGLKALNVNPGFVTGFAELKQAESDQLLQFFKYHIHSADDHYVRWKWAAGSIALWDNVNNLFTNCEHSQAADCLLMYSGVQRITIHRVIPGNYSPGSRRGIRTTVFGEKRKLTCFLLY